MIDAATLTDVKKRVADACDRSGRTSPDEVQILAITKTFPAEAIEAAYSAGLTAIGENRVQEAADKFPQLPHLPQLKKRLVGHLQSNKAKKAVTLFDAIDSIDSLKLARNLDAKAADREERLEVLLQVNTASDPSKHGFDTNETDTFLEIVEMKNLEVKGLMTIGELTSEEAVIRKTFRKLREVKESLNEQLPAEKRVTELSMGMSGDFEIAVEEGATMVRLGTALFGARG